MSKHNDMLAAQLRGAGIGGWEREVRFLSKRKFAFDFAWRKERVAVEVHGQVYDGAGAGRHNRAQGFTNDREKMRYAALSGWWVLEFTGAEVQRGVCVDWIAAMLKKAEKWKSKERCSNN